MISLVNVCKQYNKNKVIDNFSAAINNGEKVAVVAESGKGKTTLFNIIIGIEKKKYTRYLASVHLNGRFFFLNNQTQSNGVVKYCLL